MGVKRPSTQKRHERVKRIFNELHDTKEHGVRKFNYKWCLAETGEKCDYEPATIERIINERY